jgi:hypothetical protein
VGNDSVGSIGGDWTGDGTIMDMTSPRSWKGQYGCQRRVLIGVRQLIEDRRPLLCKTAVPGRSVGAFDTSLDRCRASMTLSDRWLGVHPVFVTIAWLG